MCTHRGSVRGFTLIEILITLLVLCIGTLGVVSLQTAALRHSVDTATQTQVSWLMAALAARMRANAAAADHYTMTLTAADCASAPPRCGDGSGTDGRFCSAAQLARFDVWDVFCGFHRRARQSPSNASKPGYLKSLRIRCLAAPCNAGGRYQLDVRWQPRATGALAGGVSSVPPPARHLQLTVVPR